MNHWITTLVGIFALLTLDACGSSAPASSGGTGGTLGSGGKTGTGGTVGSGGRSGTGGAVGAGGRTGSGGATGVGSGGSGGQTSGCPYKVTSFSCDAACAKLGKFSARCQNDPAVPEDMKAMLGLYGGVAVICTNTCAVVSPSSEAQWGCFQGAPDDAPCATIAGCTATNCP